MRTSAPQSSALTTISISSRRINGQKTCRRCLERKSKSEFKFIHAGPYPRWDTRCGNCREKINNERAATATRECKRCHERKPPDQFGRSRSGRLAKNCDACREEIKATRRPTAWWGSAEGKRYIRKLKAEREGRPFVAGKPWLSGRAHFRLSPEVKRKENNSDLSGLVVDKNLKPSSSAASHGAILR